MTLLAILSATALFWWNTNMVDAHGYTTISRGFLCKEGRNYDCGNISFEPQSLEGTKGFPGAGPPDGKIASAGVGGFSPLDQQGSSRWEKTNVQAGSMTFMWEFSARHRTTGYEYFLTNPGWNPDAPLTRAQFDLQPFCTVSSGGAQPNPTETHSCNLPARQGYHVILAVWTVDDTAMAFYNVMDVSFDGSNPQSPPAPPGPSGPPPSSPPGTSPGNYCGNGWQDAGKCATACPGGMNSECPGGETCYGNISCSSSGTPPGPPPPATPPGPSPPATSTPGNYCGNGWQDAGKCATACPGGMNSECPGGETCYGNISCSSSGGGGGAPASPPGNYCGAGSWSDAQKCQTSCPGGMNSECPGGETCYASITCG